MNIFELSAVLTLNKDGYEKGLEDTQKKTISWTSKIKNLMQNEAVASFLLVAKAVVEVGKKINQLMNQSLQFADQQGELAAKLGVSTQAIGEMQYIATQTGTTIEGLQGSMSALYLRAKSDGEAFKQLGISVQDSNGNFKAMDELFYETIGALNTLEDENAKNSYMLDLFGRSAMTNGEILRKTTEEIDEMRQKANDLGIVLDESTTDFAGNWFDKIDELKLQGQGALASLTAGAPDAEEKLQNFFDNVMEMLDTYIPTFANFAVRLVVQGAIALIKIAPSLAGDIIGTVIETIVNPALWINAGINAVTAFMEGFVNIFVSTINSLFGWLGVNIPRLDIPQLNIPSLDQSVGTEYEISENVKQDISIKLEASGDTAVSQDTAEQTAKALAPYIDKILGGK